MERKYFSAWCPDLDRNIAIDKYKKDMGQAFCPICRQAALRFVPSGSADKPFFATIGRGEHPSHDPECHLKIEFRGNREEEPFEVEKEITLDLSEIFSIEKQTKPTETDLSKDKASGSRNTPKNAEKTRKTTTEWWKRKQSLKTLCKVFLKYRGKPEMEQITCKTDSDKEIPFWMNFYNVRGLEKYQNNKYFGKYEIIAWGQIRKIIEGEGTYGKYVYAHLNPGKIKLGVSINLSSLVKKEKLKGLKEGKILFAIGKTKKDEKGVTFAAREACLFEITHKERG